jgi:hypothetical protein
MIEPLSFSGGEAARPSPLYHSRASRQGDIMEELKDGADIGSGLTQIRTEDAVPWLRSIASQLKDGGELRLEVPDLDGVMKAYNDGEPETEKMLIGEGAKSLWNREKLSRVLNLAGFEVSRGKNGWAWNETKTKISVVARKFARPFPNRPMRDIHCIMSLPRVCWTDTQGVLHHAAASLGFDVTRATGVFWGQCLERLLETCLTMEGVKYVLTVDYDSIFDAEDIIRLWQVMETRPDVAALCPLQIGRDKNLPLFSIKNGDGTLLKEMTEDRLYTDALEMNTGHFGLTLIRLDAIRDLPRPFFLGVPNKDGNWGDGRVDDDIHFWNRLRDGGRKICLCPRVRIGHLQNVVTWPAEDCRAITQYLSDFHSDGRPTECMTF